MRRHVEHISAQRDAASSLPAPLGPGAPLPSACPSARRGALNTAGRGECVTLRALEGNGEPGVSPLPWTGACSAPLRLC